MNYYKYDEKVGHFPSDWNLCKVGSLGEFYGGSTPPTTDEKNWDGNIVWLVPSDLTSLSEASIRINDSGTKITEAGFRSCSTVMLPVGTLCISSRATIGEAAIADIELCTNQGFINVVTDKKYDPVYLLYWVKQNKNYISRYGAGTTFLEIGRRSFRKLKIALPQKLQERKAIAGILSKVDEAVDTFDNSIKAAERLKKSLMQNLLTGKLKPDGTWRTKDEFEMTKIGMLPKTWSVKQVKELSLQVTDGEHTTPQRSESGFYLLSARNIKNGYLDLTNVDYLQEKELRRIQKRCNPEPGDILISCSGTIGNVCTCPEYLDAGMVRSVALVKLREDKIESEFAESVFQSFCMQNQMKVSVSSSVQGNIFQGAIKKLRIPYPPTKKERLGISDMIRTFIKVVEDKQSKIQSLKTLKKSLMQNLLTGKVRVDVEKINQMLGEVN